MRTCWSVSAASSSSSGSRAHLFGTIAQPPAGRKRSGSTAGSSAPRPGASDDSGTLRFSRAPRVRARLVRMRRIQVFSVERPSSGPGR
jgi:hypothetical protein